MERQGWLKQYRKLKCDFHSRGYNLINTRSGFRSKINNLRMNMGWTINQEKITTEFLTMLAIIKQGGNVVQNIEVLDQYNNVIRIPMLWVEEGRILDIEQKVDGVERHNEKMHRLNGLDIQSIQIPEEVSSFFKNSIMGTAIEKILKER